MPIIICAYCGEPFAGRVNARFCSKACYNKSLEARSPGQQESKDPDICQYNDGVLCYPAGECKQCGWNPAVAQSRLNRILADMLGVEVLTNGR